jgi:hypothetical protein
MIARARPVAVAALALTLAACGGGSHRRAAASDPPATAPTATSAGAASVPVASREAGRRGPGHKGQSTASAPTPGTAPSAGGAYSPGGGGAAEPSSGVDAAVAPAGFEVKADAICRAYRSGVQSVGQATTLTAQEHVYAQVIDDARAAIGRLDRLQPPAADTGRFRSFLSDTSAAIDAFVAAQSRSRSTHEATGVAVEQGDFAAFQRVGRESAAAGTQARALGLRVCGSSGSDWL